MEVVTNSYSSARIYELLCVIHISSCDWLQILAVFIFHGKALLARPKDGMRAIFIKSAVYGLWCRD